MDVIVSTLPDIPATLAAAWRSLSTLGLLLAVVAGPVWVTYPRGQR